MFHREIFIFLLTWSPTAPASFHLLSLPFLPYPSSTSLSPGPVLPYSTVDCPGATFCTVLLSPFCLCGHRVSLTASRWRGGQTQQETRERKGGLKGNNGTTSGASAGLSFKLAALSLAVPCRAEPRPTALLMRPLVTEGERSRGQIDGHHKERRPCYWPKTGPSCVSVAPHSRNDKS